MDYYSLDKKKGFLVSSKSFITQGSRLLILKDALGVLIKKPQWGLPGGLIEINESLKEGLIREVKEETGLEVSVGDIFTAWNYLFEGFKFRDGRIMDIKIINIAFLCKKINGQLRLSDEHSRFKWATKSELKSIDFSSSTLPAIIKYLRLK